MLADAPDRTAEISEADRKVVSIVYTNYRGETSVRRIVPEAVRFGATEWHPEEQWLLDAHDLDKDAQRSFALKDIRSCFA
jgi:predicted DNA-binding transcriptional regulator YafY